MIRVVARFLIFTIVFFCAQSQLQTAQAAPPVEAYAQLPTFADLDISPGGRYLAARVNVGGKYVVGAFELSDFGFERIYAAHEEDGLYVDWFRWANEDRLLMSVGFTAKRRSGLGGTVQTEERRLVTLDAKTGKITPLYPVRRDEPAVQIQDRIVSFLPKDPEHILVQYSKADPSEPNVVRVSVSGKGRHRRIERGRRGVLNWLADVDGNVRLGSGVKDEKHPFLIIRDQEDSDWLEFSHRVQHTDVVFNVVGFSPDPKLLYVVSNHEGDPSGLYTFDVASDTFRELIFKHSDVDIRSVKIHEKTSQLLSVNFVDDKMETHVFQERPISEMINERRDVLFAGKKLSTRSVSMDGQHAVIRVRDPMGPGRYYLYDGVASRYRKLPSQYPELDDVPPGKTIATRYVARDGLEIPAFVTLPAGMQSMEDAKNLPFVIHPHGGPGAQDFQRFDYLVQFLVSRGYGVLQMNFRGSTGYGHEFKSAGDKEWGQSMQDDVTDGVGWLVENGYAAVDRLAIVGGSYGGYVALMGAVKTPDLYQCAVSFAGVSDLPDLISHERRFIAGAYRTRFVGRLWKDRKMLATNSPARRADEIQIPILLMHGDQDTVVEVDQSEKMAKQLRKNDKDVDFIVFEGGDHHLSLYQNRLRFLVEIERFLGKCI